MFVFIVDSEDGAGESENFSESGEYRRMYFSCRRYAKRGEDECASEEAERDGEDELECGFGFHR